MKIVTALPNRVREIENCWIPMPDGCRLAARIWLPEDAPTRPVPAIIEYIPYRKRDRTRWRDEPMHRYFAGHGYAAARIDLRGCGESDGVLLDEYLEQEQQDAMAAIRWVACQPWCSGAVGMMGMSWGGINALQVAARQPPELKAVLAVHFTDDRYANDAHYMGGCLLAENLVWGSVLFTLVAQPPDRQLVPERWRDLWFERLDSNRPFAADWLRHQRCDEYWKQGSVCADFSRIQCPVYAIGGWADSYKNAIPRLMAGLTVPRKGLIGPWGHLYPHEGVPGPAIGFLQEALRWWDQWLKGISTAVMDEPMLRVWMQDSMPPASFCEQRPGRWVAEDSWPSDGIHLRRYFLNRHRLEASAHPEVPLQYRGPQTVGLAGGAWCPFGLHGEHPVDQREDDGKSLAFESDPLDEPIEILGAPAVELALTVDRPHAFVAVRLNDVAADGSSSRVSYGLLNLTHRASHEQPEPLEPGRRYVVRVQLNDVAHVFPLGHRIRVAISTSYWPMVWPSPEAVTLCVFSGSSSLELPVRPPRDDDARLRPFLDPEGAPPPRDADLHPESVERIIERDLVTGQTSCTTTVNLRNTGGPVLWHLHDIDLKLGHGMQQRFTITEGDPLSAVAEVTHHTAMSRDEWSVHVETRTRLSASRDAFRLTAQLDAYESDRRVFSRTWEETVLRDML